MAWAKLDDGMHSHPKFMGVSLGAVGLWAIGLSYAADYLTDGFVPRPVALGRDERAAEYAEELVAAGLWNEVPRGWMVHNYLDFNPSRAEVEGAREERSAKAKAAAEKRWASRRQSTGHAGGNASSMPGADQHASNTHPHVYAPDPTRPDPSVSTGVETEAAGARDGDAVVVPAPPAVRPEIDTACDNLAAASMHVHDRRVVQRLADEYPEVDIVEASISCARWGKDKRVRHPYNALRSIVESDDAPKRRVSPEKASRFARFDRVVVR